MASATKKAAKRASEAAAQPKTARAAPAAKKKASPKAAAEKPAAAAQTGDHGVAAGVRTLTCELDHGPDDKVVKVSWKLDGKRLPGGDFSIDREELRDRSKKIHESLKELEAVGATFADAPDKYTMPLRNLALAGSRFANTVTGKTGETSAKGSFHEWFTRNAAAAPAGAYEMLVIHRNLDSKQGKKQVAPWHLGFTAADASEIDKLKPERDAYANFWCMQFKLSVVSPNYVDSTDRDLSANETRISAVLEVDQYRMREQRHTQGGERNDKDILVHTRDDMLAQTEKHKKLHQFSYVWLHPSGGGYKLGDEVLDDEVLLKNQDRIPADRVSITMFDGDCIMRDRTDWIEPLMTRLRGGVIAPETDIKDPAQLYFGWLLLKKTLQHAHALSDALMWAREELWPRSLLYGFYCNARSVHIEPIHTLDQMFGEIDRFIGVQSGG